MFAPVSALSDWELGWYLTAVRMSGLTQTEEEIREERKRRGPQNKQEDPAGIYPEINYHPVRS
ncbi:hypothetical protein [Desulfonatronospira sp.]|uniref:hypothetical protein n=1 Tax=Desulfonatronospira sp. TaxID=1962951 RepID=UPI0025B7B1B8|nr:hypothetical protein [Desulfonatronospira sp.]